ncbi:hypothetical protein [Labrenzia sp. PHM005]|uniref:hypothetical protein n=1 Tax=Labrenzia sp. PHM005 TaxID=2590016 RepID=UPI001AD948B8|nr:hypothetical protein [Labrenzia sp. PHM005]
MSAIELSRLASTVFLAVSLVVVGDTCGKLLTQAGVAPLWWPGPGLPSELWRYCHWPGLAGAI